MADIDLPQPDTEIMAEWGQSIAKALNGMQMGTVQIPISNASSGMVVVTFPKRYRVPPVIVVSSGPGNSYSWVAAYTDNLNGDTFKAIAFHRAGTNGNATPTVSWIAIGELA